MFHNPYEKKAAREINYLMFAERTPDVYPTCEGFYVVAPLYMETKLRGPIERFNERWDRVVAGLPLNPEKIKEEELLVCQ
jgi:hypothetical protein